MKTIPTNIATEISKDYNAQPVIIVKLTLNGSIRYFSPFQIAGMDNRLMEVSNFQETIQDNKNASYSDCEITLDDSDAGISGIIKTEQLIGAPAEVLLQFYKNNAPVLNNIGNGPATILLLKGKIGTPINHISGKRLFKFKILSNTTQGETFGRDVTVSAGDPARLNPWPLQIGTSIHLLQEALLVKELPSGITTTGYTNLSYSDGNYNMNCDDLSDFPSGDFQIFVKCIRAPVQQYQGNVQFYGETTAGQTYFKFSAGSGIFESFGFPWVFKLTNSPMYCQMVLYSGTNQPLIASDSNSPRNNQAIFGFTYAGRASSDYIGSIGSWSTYTIPAGFDHGSLIIFYTYNSGGGTDKLVQRATGYLYVINTYGVGSRNINLGIVIPNGSKIKFSGHDTEYTVNTMSTTIANISPALTSNVEHWESWSGNDGLSEDQTPTWFIRSATKINNTTISISIPARYSININEPFWLNGDSVPTQSGTYWGRYILNRHVTSLGTNQSFALDYKTKTSEDVTWKDFGSLGNISNVDNKAILGYMKYPPQYFIETSGYESFENAVSMIQPNATPTRFPDIIEAVLAYAGYTVFGAGFASGSAAYDSYTGTCFCSTNTDAKIVEIAAQIAFEHRCALRYSDGVWNMVYLAVDPTAIMTITNDMIEEGSLELVIEGDYEIYNEFDGSAGDYATEGSNNKNGVKVHYKLTGAELTIPKKYPTIEFISTRDSTQMLATLKYWGYVFAYSWKRIRLKCMLDVLTLEPFDAVNVTSSFLQEHFGTTTVKCRVIETNYDYGNHSVTLTLETAYRAKDGVLDSKYWTGGV